MTTVQTCLACEKLLPVAAERCPSCGEPVGNLFQLPVGEEESFTGLCPRCEEPLFVEDGYCALCGTIICGRCGQQVDEEDEVCSHCHIKLYFDCPECRFELSAGTHICPNCNLLFPRFCTSCGSELETNKSTCGECGDEVAVIKRQSARVIHRLPVGAGVVEIVACLGCGTQFNPAIGACPDCDFRSCPRCQIGLVLGEAFCPNCGLDFCPTCGAIVLVDAAACARCGTEFDFSCPQCEAVVAVNAGKCPECGQLF